MLGVRPQDLVGKSCFDMVHAEDKQGVMAASARLNGSGAVSTAEFRTYRADGSIVWVESNFKQASERDNPAEAEFVGVLRDITERKRMEDELTLLNRRLTQLAATDGLTGLTNRRTFDGFLARQYEACEEISVLLFDIDNFKGYNDTYGHQAGDRCLQAVARAIGDATSNTSGLSARYGGEEFAVVLPNISEDDALKVAESIRLTVRALGLPNTAANRGFVTISAGIATRTRSTSVKLRWSGKPMSRSMKPSGSAAIAASSIHRRSCAMSRPGRSSTIRNWRPPNGSWRISARHRGSRSSTRPSTISSACQPCCHSDRTLRVRTNYLLRASAWTLLMPH